MESRPQTPQPYVAGEPHYEGFIEFVAAEAGIKTETVRLILAAQDFLHDCPDMPAYHAAMERLSEHPEKVHQAYRDYYEIRDLGRVEPELSRAIRRPLPRPKHALKPCCGRSLWIVKGGRTGCARASGRESPCSWR